MTIFGLLLVIALSLAIGAPPAESQQRAAPPRVGFLTPSSAALGGWLLDAFRDGLREHGYTDGVNVIIEPRFADGYERVPGLLDELLSLKPDVLVVATTPVALAAQKATRTIPIVFSPVADLVGAGLVKSLAKPGGNITGFSDIAGDLTPKRLALLSEVVPRISRIGLLGQPDNPNHRIVAREIESAARKRGLTVARVDMRHRGDVDAAFAALSKAGAQAVIVLADLQMSDHMAAIAAAANSRRLPLMGYTRRWVQVGGLLSYGIATTEYPKSAAGYVAKILQGARPAELPVLQPTRFELAVNRKTAKALGLAIPPAVLLRADEVID
jgi:putative ABC transport system substrate-binding protein